MPQKELLQKYLDQFSNKLLKNKSNKLIISGRITAYIKVQNNPQISTFRSTKEVVQSL